MFSLSSFLLKAEDSFFCVCVIEESNLVCTAVILVPTVHFKAGSERTSNIVPREALFIKGTRLINYYIKCKHRIRKNPQSFSGLVLLMLIRVVLFSFQMTKSKDSQGL